MRSLTEDDAYLIALGPDCKHIRRLSQSLVCEASIPISRWNVKTLLTLFLIS
jgi:hypothetical protein